MLNLLYDFVPVVLFFIVFKVYGIYVATVVGIITTAVQVLISVLWKKHLDKQQLITLIVFLVFGGMTLYFHNPLFVKWKPTVVYWVFAIILFFSHFIGNKPIIQRLLERVLEEHASVPKSMWSRLNAAWTVFFVVLGGVNLYVAYSFSTNAWVNFKLYGMLSLLLGFSFLQAMCLTKYLSEKNHE